MAQQNERMSACLLIRQTQRWTSSKETLDLRPYPWGRSLVQGVLAREAHAGGRLRRNHELFIFIFDFPPTQLFLVWVRDERLSWLDFQRPLSKLALFATLAMIVYRHNPSS